MSRTSRRLVLLAVLALAAGAVGCIGLFRPATPEPPLETGGGNDLIVDYSTPAATLETMAAAFPFRGRSDAVAAYMGGFSNPEIDGVPFTVEFDARAVAGRTVPTWTRAREQLFYASLFELDGDPFVFVWNTYEGPDDFFDEAAGTATLYREYELVAISDAGSTRLAAGRADLEFRKLPLGTWVITRWVDIVDPRFEPDPVEPGDRSFSRRRLDSPGAS